MKHNAPVFEVVESDTERDEAGNIIKCYRLHDETLKEQKWLKFRMTADQARRDALELFQVYKA